MVETLGAQTPLAIVHCRTLVPKFKLLTPLAGERLLLKLMLPAPVNAVQVPTPKVIVLAASTVVGVFKQSV